MKRAGPGRRILTAILTPVVALGIAVAVATPAVATPAAAAPETAQRASSAVTNTVASYPESVTHWCDWDDDYPYCHGICVLGLLCIG